MTSEPRDDANCLSPQDSDLPIGDCEEAVRQLYNFLDDELTPDLRIAFKAHLDACGPCVEIVTFEAELRRVIANKCQDRVPEELRQRIAAAIVKEANGRR
jgi:mycothiol system anti-sigma-R factor